MRVDELPLDCTLAPHFTDGQATRKDRSRLGFSDWVGARAGTEVHPDLGFVSLCFAPCFRFSGSRCTQVTISNVSLS
jgi:hypothetical protein